MAYCKECGAVLPEGTKFCSECGAPVQSAAEHPPKKPKRKRRTVFGRWWFWLLVVIAAAGVFGRNGLSKLIPAPKNTEPAAVAIPERTTKETARPTPTPATTEAEEPETPTLTDALIRPEVKEALDSYEAYMDESIAFMERYKAADATDMVAMMGDYTDMLSRYAEFAKKIAALGESELTNAELAYYLEVTNRVSQKLLSAAG